MRAAFALALAFLLAAAPAGAETTTVPGDSLAVVDGDTVRLDGRRLRLLAIDAPETHEAHCRAERREGNRAGARLAALLARRPVAIEWSGSTDRYDRPLVNLRVPEGDIGQILLAEGLALPYRPGGTAHAARIAHWCGGSP